MSSLRAAVLAALFLFVTGVPALSQDVTLTSRDGRVEIGGTLLGFDGEFYRVDTIYGELTVDGSGVRCVGPGCPSLEDFVAELRVSGSATMGDVLVPALLEAFALRNAFTVERVDAPADNGFEYHLRDSEAERVVARFFFRPTNTDEGFADLLADEADIVMAQREIRPAEVTLAREAGLGDLTTPNRSRVLALDAMVPIAAPGNPVREIATSDLSALFAGDIRNWNRLGGPNAPVALHIRDAASGLGQAVPDRLLTPVGRTLADGVVRHATNSTLAEAVARDPFALGIASYSEIGNAQPLVLTGGCGFSLTASRRTIKTEDYPLTAPMFLYLPARRLPKVAREFLAYTRSPSAQIVIRRAGFVDQAPEEIPVNAQGDRFANAIKVAGDDLPLGELQRMARVLTPMKRLTTSFRFRAGSSDLDAQSLSNVQQLARALEAGQYDTRRLLFVGFSDGEGPAVSKRDIAAKRAGAVLGAVKAAAETASFDRLNLGTEAFGEAMPMACDDTAWGRQVNRRVEVWVR